MIWKRSPGSLLNPNLHKNDFFLCAAAAAVHLWGIFFGSNAFREDPGAHKVSVMTVFATPPSC